jgi:acyl-CoA synthetase (AMP-forming)/AMP-acid ligase II
MNIALFLEMAAADAPDRIGLVCAERRWTYKDLDRAARGAAGLVRSSGSARVALLDEQSEAALIALFGAAIAGAAYCPLNYRLADVDLASLLDRIAPAMVVGGRGRVERLARTSAHTCFERESFVSAALHAASDAAGACAPGDGVAVQLFTSGTTAAPKAAVLDHANIAAYILSTVEFAAATEDEAALVAVPPYHIAGIAALASSIYAQRRIVLLPSFDPEDWITLAQDEKVTHAFLVPTMLGRILQSLDQGRRADLSCLRAIAYGGGKMPTALIRQALDRFPDVAFANAYGLTETSSTIALLGPEDHRAAHQSSDPRIAARIGSVGRPLPSIELEIRDEEGRTLPAGCAGEVYVRGDQVSGRYRERSALDCDGWFATRDAGYLDQDGYLFLLGRADDVIVRGGENISPGEIEDVLVSHPAIADVAAVAVPSLEWGETVGVALVVRDGYDPPAISEIQDMVRARLRSSRTPEIVRFMLSLPYNEMGKLLRREIRVQMST